MDRAFCGLATSHQDNRLLCRHYPGRHSISRRRITGNRGQIASSNVSPSSTDLARKPQSVTICEEGATVRACNQRRSGGSMSKSMRSTVEVSETECSIRASYATGFPRALPPVRKIGLRRRVQRHAAHARRDRRMQHRRSVEMSERKLQFSPGAYSRAASLNAANLRKLALGPRDAWHIDLMSRQHARAGIYKCHALPCSGEGYIVLWWCGNA